MSKMSIPLCGSESDVYLLGSPAKTSLGVRCVADLSPFVLIETMTLRLNVAHPFSMNLIKIVEASSGIVAAPNSTVAVEYLTSYMRNPARVSL